MKIEEIIAKANELVENVKGIDPSTTKQSVEVEKVMAEVAEVIKDIKEAGADESYSFSEIMKIIMSVIDVIKEATFITDIENVEDAANIVIEILKEVYFGEEFLNNPNISLIPDFIEDKIENTVFDYVLPGIVESLIIKNKGEANE